MRTIRGYKMYIFKMMHDIVKKNINNYINLLTNGTSCREIPTHDEILADIYVMFDRCIDKFNVKKGAKFYYYFNKSISRNLYREYQKIQKRTAADMDEDASQINHVKLQYHSHNYDTGLLIDRLHFNDLERRILESRLRGQRISEFLKENPDVNNMQYTLSMRHIKSVVNEARENGTW